MLPRGREGPACGWEGSAMLSGRTIQDAWFKLFEIGYSSFPSCILACEKFQVTELS